MHNLYEIELLELHTPAIASDPNVISMSKALDSVFRESVGYIDNIEIMKRLVERTITEDWLVDELAHQFHVDWYDASLPIETRLDLVAAWMEVHLLKGTPHAVQRVVEIVFSDAEVLEWFEYGGKPYTFKVATELTHVTAVEVQKLIDVIYSVKNTRSWLEAIEVLWNTLGEWHVGMALAQEITTKIIMRAIWKRPEHLKDAYGFSFQMVRDTAVSMLEIPEPVSVPFALDESFGWAYMDITDIAVNMMGV